MQQKILFQVGNLLINLKDDKKAQSYGYITWISKDNKTVKVVWAPCYTKGFFDYSYRDFILKEYIKEQNIELYE